jgi:hypothetical protein
MGLADLPVKGPGHAKMTINNTLHLDAGFRFWVKTISSVNEPTQTKVQTVLRMLF